MTWRCERRLLMVALMGLTAGCQLPYFLMNKEPKRKVAAEYDKLGGRTIAVVVWADQATLDEDYAVRFRVADTLRYYIRQAVPDAKFVDTREVTEFQEGSGLDWEGMTNVELGRRFKADLVLRVDLLEYTTRSRDARSVRQGRIRATMSIYEVGRPDGNRAVYSTEVAASYPQDTRANVLDLSDIDLLNGTLRVFGEVAARKFHEHEVSY